MVESPHSPAIKSDHDAHERELRRIRTLSKGALPMAVAAPTDPEDAELDTVVAQYSPPSHVSAVFTVDC